MITQNKKAGAKLLSIWWFLVIIVVFIGIVAGTSMFKTYKLDVREAESAIIVNRLIDCTSIDGKFSAELFNNTNFLTLCGFNSTIIEKSSLYFVKISLLSMNDTVINQTSFGNSGFEEACKITLAADAKKYPRCFNRTILTTNTEGDLLKLNLIAGSNYEVGTS